MAGNSNLGAAKAVKNDEFYTQYADIQKEINAYLEYNSDTFRDKTVLLPCDDPEWSNFTRFFAQNFERLGLKRLISTSYAVESKKYKDYEPTLFETECEWYDPDKTRIKGKIFELNRDQMPGQAGHDEKCSGHGDSVTSGSDRGSHKKLDLDALEWHYLEGDGDFRSPEVCALRDQADIIVTNPPFSLFREFVAWVSEAQKQCLIIGNKNCITYKEVFPLIKENKLWVGYTPMGIDMLFDIPKGMEQTYLDTEKEGSKYRIIGGKIYARAAGIWLTNLEHGRRHEPLRLMTMKDNLRFSRHKEIRENGYQKYDNYDAIEVPYTDAIPSDYYECLGVPVTFLDKYNPEQFEVLGSEKQNDGIRTKVYPPQIQVDSHGKRSVVTKLNDGAAIKVEDPKGQTYYEVDGDKFVQVYKRIFIKAIGGGYNQMNINELRNVVTRDFGFLSEEVVIVSGVMGVPISFLDKYCPEQFEIVGISKTWYGLANKVYPEQLQHSKDGKVTRVTKLNDGPVIKLVEAPNGETYYTVGNDIYTQEYARIFIRRNMI